MSSISTRIDKGQKRFQPKLKARPNRNKPTASEDGTPAPTPPIGGSDSGSFGSSLLELETTTSASSTATTTTLIATTQGDTEAVVASAASSATLVQHTATTASSVQKDLSRRLSTATPMSPTQNKSIVSPRSPIVTPTKVTKDRTSQATAISIPSSDAGSSSAAHAISSSNSALSKQSKGASVISVPTARSYSELEETDEMEEAEGSNSAKKRSKGKSTRLRNQPIVYNDDGEEMTEDGEELVPDYANMYMYQFTRDLGVGKRSKVYQEHQKALETKRRVSKRKERIEAIRRMEGRGPSPTPGDDDDDDDEDREDDDNDDLAQDEDGSGNGEANKEEKTARARSEINTPKPAPQPKTFAPQVRVVDGQIELDVDSLVVDHDIVEAGTHQEPMEYVEESSTTKFVNNSSFTRKIASERWSEKDTDLFYEALAQWGTDFGIICRLFPSKTRIAVRNKYKREDRYNHSRVEEALNSRRPIDLDKYSKMIGTEFPEVSEEDLIKKLPDVDEDDQAPVGTPDFEDEYGDGEEIVEEKAQEEEAEEIIGMIE